MILCKLFCVNQTLSKLNYLVKTTDNWCVEGGNRRRKSKTNYHVPCLPYTCGVKKTIVSK